MQGIDIFYRAQNAEMSSLGYKSITMRKKICQTWQDIHKYISLS